MQISQEEFQRRMNFYTSCIPRWDWFSPEEQEKLVLEADQNAKIYQANFLSILENLTFMRSFTKVGKPIIV